MVRSPHKRRSCSTDLRPGEAIDLSTLDAPNPSEDFAEAVAAVADDKIQGRSLSQIAWRRLRKDKVALAGGVFIVFLIVVAIFAPLITNITGGRPNEYHAELVDPALGPYGTFGGMSWDHPMGVEPITGRDIFSRVLYGARVSLLIALAATAFSVILGTVIGIISGFFGGWIDAILSRLMDMFLAFPILVFAHRPGGRLPRQGVRALRRPAPAGDC